MTWILKDNFFNILQKARLDVHIKFRTRDPDGGVLLHLPSNSHEFISVQVAWFLVFTCVFKNINVSWFIFL